MRHGSKRSGAFWVMYQPAGDYLTHIRYFDTYEEADRVFEAVRIFHDEFDIPVRIEMRDFGSQTSAVIKSIKTTKEEYT